MKFAHFADCHLGSWKEEIIKELNMQAFEKTINTCINENVNFILISGDLFNSPFPPIETMKRTAKALRTLKENNIPIYAIAGSHDFTTTGKTMLDVFDNAGLMHNVCPEGKPKIYQDKTGTTITGMIGLAGGLDKNNYLTINRTELEKLPSPKIFLFHGALAELKTKGEGMPMSLLPQNFDYYAGGHVHETIVYKNIVYPGALFPNNFAELEQIQNGTFMIVENNTPKKIELNNKVINITLDCTKMTPKQAEEELLKKTSEKMKGAIITIRLQGIMDSPSQVQLKPAIEAYKKEGALTVIKNTIQLQPPKTTGMTIPAGNAEEIEKRIIKEKSKNPDIVEQWMKALSSEINEGETKTNYETRILNEAKKLLES
ncbi:exonuclease SbcCD subunit D [Candidatus Woesearchaeota archaeon]|nr:exonuclease SbcCD subunit D [Candidatus Woesearchaeota archaeon]